MAPVHRVALIQLYSEPLQPDINFERAASFIRKAASAGAHLAVLPEYHLSSWIPRDPRFAQQSNDWEIYLQKYQDLAKSLNICIAPGTIVQPRLGESNEDSSLFNVAYFIDNKGEIRGEYRKGNLWHPERVHLTAEPHAPHLMIQTPLGPVGFLICWDLAFPEAFRELIAQGVKIIIIPSFWGLNDCSEYGLALNSFAEKLFLESTLTSRAFENTCAVIFVNAGAKSGRSNPNRFAGLSRATLPFIGALGEETKDSSEEGMSIVDIDMDILEEAEANYKVRADMKREDWHYVYRHDFWEGNENRGQQYQRQSGSVDSKSVL